MIYVLCDFYLTSIKAQDATELMDKETDAKKKHGHSIERRNQLIWLSCILADAPLALQYSMVQGPFTQTQLNWAGLYGGVAGLYLRYIRNRDA